MARKSNSDTLAGTLGLLTVVAAAVTAYLVFLKPKKAEAAPPPKPLPAGVPESDRPLWEVQAD